MAIDNELYYFECFLACSIPFAGGDTFSPTRPPACLPPTRLRSVHASMRHGAVRRGSSICSLAHARGGWVGWPFSLFCIFFVCCLFWVGMLFRASSRVWIGSLRHADACRVQYHLLTRFALAFVRELSFSSVGRRVVIKSVYFLVFRLFLVWCPKRSLVVVLPG